MDSAGDTPEGVGFPIRTSADHRALAPPRGLSQRATSFVASWRLGIHRTPFRRSGPPLPPARRAGPPPGHLGPLTSPPDGESSTDLKMSKTRTLRPRGTAVIAPGTVHSSTLDEAD